MKCEDFANSAPLAAQLVFVGHGLSRLIERRLACHDYSHTQVALIMTLDRQPGQMAQELAEHVLMEPPSITRALQILERRELVERRPHPTDGRASLFYLTAKGREAAAAMAQLLQDTSAEVEAGVTADHREALRLALAEILTHIEAMRGTEV
ncbi:MAG: MarR family transcriptional regulator [Dehalococcoidales bacterium]|nr:MarR family transcriptional regulator [Dehalococcoidales bacterium]